MSYSKTEYQDLKESVNDIIVEAENIAVLFKGYSGYDDLAQESQYAACAKQQLRDNLLMLFSDTDTSPVIARKLLRRFLTLPKDDVWSILRTKYCEEIADGICYTNDFYSHLVFPLRKTS